MKYPTLSEVRRALARKSLEHFVRHMWPAIEPGTELKWSWYLSAICEHLQAVTSGEIKNLLITIPPRFLKSTLVSIMWPAWEWIQDPSIRYLTSSYSFRLAEDFATKTRRLIESPLYQELGPKFKLATDQNVKNRYENTASGWRIVTSPGASATGIGGSRLICDDPHSAAEIHSEVSRKEVQIWWTQTMSTRLNDPKTGRKVVIMQRLHEDDLAGFLLERGGYEYLCLPTMYEQDHPGRRRTSIGFEDPRSSDGELLSPAHFDCQAVENAQKELGTVGFAGQHQQRPVPAGGVIFERKWFKYWKVLPGKFDLEILSFDLAVKGTPRGELARVKDLSYVVGQRWGFCGSNSYLLDECRGQWDFAETCRQFALFCEAHPNASVKLIEDKANGPALMSLLTDAIPGMIPWEPEGSKIERAYACQAFIEAGNVWLPDPSIHAWVTESRGFLDEVCSFPFARHNDRVDSMSQALLFGAVGEQSSYMRKLQTHLKLENLLWLPGVA